MMNNDWRQSEIEKLRTLAATGMSAGEIAQYLPGRTRNAVIGFCNRNRVALGFRKNYRVWTRKMDDKLLSMAREGLPAKLIGKAMGLPEHVVRARLNRKFGGAREIRRDVIRKRAKELGVEYV